jgi:hypothetical protein
MHFSMWCQKTNKKSFIGRNDFNFIHQSVKQMWITPFIDPSVNSSVIGPKCWDLGCESQPKGPIWWKKRIDLLKKWIKF